MACVVFIISLRYGLVKSDRLLENQQTNIIIIGRRWLIRLPLPRLCSPLVDEGALHNGHLNRRLKVDRVQ